MVPSRLPSRSYGKTHVDTLVNVGNREVTPDSPRWFLNFYVAPPPSSQFGQPDTPSLELSTERRTDNILSGDLRHQTLSARGIAVSSGSPDAVTSKINDIITHRAAYIPLNL